MTFSGNIFWQFKKMWFSKLHFTCPDENVFRFVYFEKDNFINALGLRSKSHRKIDGISCALLSKLHWKSFLMIIVFDKFNSIYMFFVLWQKTYWTFDQTFLAVLSKYTSRCPEELFKCGFSWTFLFFISFQTLS